MCDDLPQLVVRAQVHPAVAKHVPNRQHVHVASARERDVPEADASEQRLAVRVGQTFVDGRGRAYVWSSQIWKRPRRQSDGTCETCGPARISLRSELTPERTERDVLLANVVHGACRWPPSAGTETMSSPPGKDLAMVGGELQGSARPGTIVIRITPCGFWGVFWARGCRAPASTA